MNKKILYDFSDEEIGYIQFIISRIKLVKPTDSIWIYWINELDDIINGRYIKHVCRFDEDNPEHVVHWEKIEAEIKVNTEKLLERILISIGNNP